MSSVTEDQFAEATQKTRDVIERRLEELLAERTSAPENIQEALRYTLLGAGKRLRPLLCVWTHDALGGTNREACIDVACALECLHTYSLIHDDLPCMDDDDMRRGKPSCHKQFGEAIAVLAGDALLTMCFDVLVAAGEQWRLDDELVVEVTAAVARAAGTEGLITGQALDLMSDRLPASLETVEKIHRYKTAALISACMEAGAIIALADAGKRNKVAQAGRLAGQAFQIIDDVLDIQMDGETLGKTPGKDAKEGKLTYPAVAGVEASRARASALIEQAKSEFGEKTDGSLLGMLLDFMIARSK